MAEREVGYDVFHSNTECTLFHNTMTHPHQLGVREERE